MTEQQVATAAPKSKLKIIIAIIIGVIIVGAVGAYSFWQTSDKEAYFKAEIDTFDYLKDQFEDRFENELAWRELSETKPTSATIKASAEYNDPNAFGGFSEIEEIINQSSITLYTEADLKGKEMLIDAAANVAGLPFEGLRFYLTDETLLVELPFLEDALQIENADLNKILQEIDPYTFSGDEEIDFSWVFDLDNYPISAEDQEYLKEKYGKFLFEQLPDEAFSSDKEEVTVAGKKVKAEKLTLDLTEKQIKEVLGGFLNEIKDDKRFKTILEDYLKNNFMQGYEIDMIMAGFYEELELALAELDDAELSLGIQSSIWVNKGLIVQRELTVTAADEFDNSGTTAIKGTHQFSNNAQLLEYKLSFEDDFNSEAVDVDIVADLSKDGKQINDKVTISSADIQIVYEGNETLDKSDREFKRSLSVVSPIESGSLHWDGTSSFGKDEMSSSNQLYLEVDGLGGDIFTLHLDVEGEQIREVEKPNPSNVKDIGKMSEEELGNYIMFEAQEQFFNWFVENFGMPDF